ncbi:MAG TPA: HAD-IA family hydrolase [Albitalea sp.]|jgi:HAD superfamily hydrolase (TIGR01509 family)|nr:HAD-IA family hydrolase [Albitalea sp.]
MILRALIFDVDGTLADTEEVHRRSFNTAFQRAGLDWAWSREAYRELLKTNGGKERIASHIDSLVLRDGERNALQARIAEIHADKTRIYSSVVAAGRVPLRDGVARLLKEARGAGCHLAIASTTTAANVDALLHATLGARGLEMFDVIACGDLVGTKKPAPDIYQLALGTLGVAPEEAIAFEDSVNGLRSAVAAGLWTVLTPTYWTEGGDFSEAALVLPRLGDPQQPLDGEPGGRLQHAAWLTIGELTARRKPPPAPCAVHALYHGAR